VRMQMMSRRASSSRPKNRSRDFGKGQAWLIFDAGGELFKYQCYWMGGHGDTHVIEHARKVTDVDAVAWAAARTPRARIRMPDQLTYWAGTAPPPRKNRRSWLAPSAEGTSDEALVGLIGRRAS